MAPLSRAAFCLFLVWALFVGLAGEAVLPRPIGEVHALEVEGVISPASARYLARELRRAGEARAGLVVLTLDTPGGLDRSMRDMTRAILDSEVPVVVHVAPSGARAASAGLFVALAAHVAAMAPGTSIGAAHPVALGGSAPDEVAIDKATSDAAAYARSLAALRGRDAAWVEQAVLESASASAEEALAIGVIELVASDRDELLRALDGRAVATAAGPVTLETTGVDVVERPMTLIERIVQVITDPNVAYLLFSLGSVAVLVELWTPGGFVAGVTGAVALALAFVGFGSLPVSWAAIALLVLALALFVADLHTAGLGGLSVAGLIAFVLGSVLLYQPLEPVSVAMPDVAISGWVVLLVVGTLLAFFVGVGRALANVGRRPVATGAGALVGRIGVVERELAPIGTVRLDSETWTAEGVDPPVPSGSRVVVLGLQGVTLRVRRAAANPP